MAATLFIQDDSLTLLADGKPIGPRRSLDADAIATLQGFGARYTALTHWREPAALLTLGRDLHDWLDGPEGLLRRLADGVEAVSVNFYDGQAFVVPNKLAIQNLSQMSGGKVCTVRGTTHGDNATAWFRARRSRIDLVSFDTNDAMLDAFFASRCLAATLDASALASALAILMR